MTVRPILFSGPMVRALLEGRKTQTRRVLKPQPPSYLHHGKDIMDWPLSGIWQEDEYQFGSSIWTLSVQSDVNDAAESDIDVRFAPGDLLWVKETWRVDARFDRYKPRELPRTAHPNLDFLATTEPDSFGIAGKTRPSIFMLRWASRLTLRVTEVRVQRLQEISTKDIRAEGAITEDWDEWREDALTVGMPSGSHVENERDVFENLWDSLNAKRDGGAFSWASNPWVVAVSFEVIRANVDQVVEASDG
ncbi:hypothetical protein [Oceanicaulis sp.]|uniref:hypothetical protein n=1 Tax=Oceanicaulis sp. TaxID=1924941 RepID=UPI003F6EE874